MPGVEKDAPVTFYLANVSKLVQHIVASCANYAALLEAASRAEPGVCFDLVVYNDEATGGNLLQPLSSKEVSLWYFCFKQLGWLWTDVAWHPLCLIQHNEFDKIEGGFSACVKRILFELQNQNLTVGFPCAFPSGQSILRCNVKWIVSDLDSIRAALSVKGSSAMRCCLFCRNIVKKHAGLEAYSDFFQDIASCNIHAFQEQTDQYFFDVWDNLLAEKARCTKAVFNRKEIAAGFNVCPHALLSDRVLREIIPPSAFLLDCMQLFWANGVVSWEVNSAYQQWATTNIGDLEAFLALPWCFATAGNTRSWRVSMGHEYNFQGVAYKGSASNLMIFFPLFHYFLEGCMGPQGLMTKELESMRALRRTTMEMKE